jgi:hypothetical protein
MPKKKPTAAEVYKKYDARTNRIWPSTIALVEACVSLCATPLPPGKGLVRQGQIRLS